VLKQKRQFIKGTEPTEKCDLVEHKYKRTLTKYRMFDNAKVLAAVNPGDLHSSTWKFHDKFTAENHVQTSEHLSTHNVNSRRHFFHTGAKDLTTVHVPFKRLDKQKFYLWELDPEDFWGRYGIFWRHQIDMDRGILPSVCMATGWKDMHDRYKNSAWHPSHNIGVKITTKDGVRKTIYMPDNAKRIYTDSDARKIFLGVCEMAVEALRELKHPLGFKDYFQVESANEPPSHIGDKALFEFHNALFSMLFHKMKLDPTRMAFEKWDSRWIGVKKIDDKVDPGLQDLYPGIYCYYHGQNTFDQAVRWHKGEMGKIHDAYPGLCADSDGHEKGFPGQGLIGKNWGGTPEDIDFRRITPVELKQFLIYDYKHNGAGHNHLSGVGWYEDDVCNYESIVKAFVKGFTKIELMEWQAMMKEHRGILIPVDWEKFSYEKDGKRYRLSEGVAIKQAMNVIHKEVT
jgi:hypothetical protein